MIGPFSASAGLHPSYCPRANLHLQVSMEGPRDYEMTILGEYPKCKESNELILMVMVTDQKVLKTKLVAC